MRISENNLHETVIIERQAENIRREMWRNNQHNGDICEILDIKNESTVSHWKGNKNLRHIRDDHARKLADVWGVRFEYVKGYDDYRTEQELEDAAREQIRLENEDVFKALGDHMGMLERIGLMITPLIEYQKIEKDDYGDGHLILDLDNGHFVTSLWKITDRAGNLIADRVSVLGIKEQLDLIDDIAKKILMVKYSNSEKDG